MNESNIKKSIDNVRRVCGLLNNFDIIGPIGDYGDIIRRKQEISKIDSQGNIRVEKKDIFNIYKKDGTYVVNKWFDLYFPDEKGNCIIGYKRNIEEYERAKRIQDYLLMPGVLKEPYKYLYGAINSNGVACVEAVYDQLDWNRENTLTAYYNTKSGLVSLENGYQLTPIIFTSVGLVSEGYSCVCYKGQYGYANIKNTIRDPDNKLQYGIPPQYEWGSEFRGGYAKVKRNGTIIEINRFNIEKNSKIFDKLTPPTYIRIGRNRNPQKQKK